MKISNTIYWDIIIICLWGSETLPVCIPPTPPLLGVNDRIPLVEAANLTFIEGDRVLKYDLEYGNFTIWHWDNSHILNLPKGKPFTGYLFVKLEQSHKYWAEILPSNETGRELYNSTKKIHCIAIDIDDRKIKKVPGYEDQDVAAGCVMCHSIACPHSLLPCQCGWKANHALFLKVQWWTQVPPGNITVRPGRLWEPLWQSQTTAYLGVSSILLTLTWDTQRFWVDTYYPNCSHSVDLQWKQHLWWIQHYWPQNNKIMKRDLIGGIGTGLGILGPAEFAAAEERHNLEKDSLSKIGHIKGTLFQEEGKGWETLSKENEVLVRWISKTRETVQRHFQTQTWERACILTQEGLLTMLMQMESEVAMGQWPTLMNAELETQKLWPIYGSPKLWKIITGGCNSRRCILRAHVPRMDHANSYPIVQLAGIGIILNQTRILPMGSRWAIMSNESAWAPIPLSNCEERNKIWLCPEQSWNPDFAQVWPLVSTPITNSIWYMGRGKFCWESKQGEIVDTESFTCEHMYHVLNHTGVWCNTGTVGRIHLQKINKTYSNLDIEDQSFLEVELNMPHGIVPMETGWPKEELRIEDHELAQVLNYSNQQYHQIQISMEEGGKAIVKLVKNYDQTCQGFLGWLQCSFPSYVVASSLGGAAFGILLVGLIFFLCVIRRRCCIRQKNKTSKAILQTKM
ncbi:uncharacterized protein LOC123611597 [Leopardus geoffroyi]|uniref:uncharacterized protein LOC123611597 n=1 Tax=Leopardus geoffroyi TaxID=46844 RepID=UPI001E25F2C7|nr:uncharacterized protein LOC123611597 [Leopardus geoffroyi]